MLKTLGAQIKEFKKDSFLTPVFMILEVLMETIIPLMMASIIDNGVEAGDIHHIYVMGGCMVIVACISLFAGTMGGKYGARASAGFARNLRKAMYENIQTFSFSNIDKFSTAGLVTRLTTDVTNLQNAYQMLLRMCVRAPISLICAMIMAFFINARLASVYLIAVIVLGMILAIITVRAHHYFMEVFPKYDDLNASVQENVSAIRVVKAYVRELLCGISCHERSGMAATCGSCSVCYCMYGSWYRHRKNCLQTTQTCYPACRIDYSDRCQLLFTECRTVIIRCRHKVLYKCCNTAVLKTCRWKSYNLRNHDRDGSCLCHHHGWSDDFYQKNKSRTGDACCF